MYDEQGDDEHDDDTEYRIIGDEEQIAFLVENLRSTIGDDGNIYVHAGHLVELYEAGVDLISSLPDLLEEAGIENPGVERANLMGVQYIVGVIHLMLSALQARHANEMELPVDELVKDLSDLLREEDK